MAEAKENSRGRRQVLVGTIVSDKGEKTVIVNVERTVMHNLYHRYMKKTKRYAAHDEGNVCQIGDEVVIVACRPMSKTKRWRVREVTKRAQG